MVQDNIADAMNLPKLSDVEEPEEREKSLPARFEEAISNETVLIDANYVRTNLYDVIEKGSDALEELVEIAKQSQSPRAFEVISTLISTITSSSMELLKNQQVAREIVEVADDEPKVGKIEANNVFFGTTSEVTSNLGHKDVRDLLKPKGEVIDGSASET